MAEINLKTDFRSEAELKTIKNAVMKWYSGNTRSDKECFYKDALEDILGYVIYGHYGESMRAEMLINSWIREAEKAKND